MIQQPNRLEMGILKLIVARFRSKSPKGYALLAKIAGIIASIMGAYVLSYGGGAIPPHFHLIGTVDTGALDNVFVVAGAAFTALGLVSASTTTDPTLISPAVKQSVLTEAVVNGTHKEVATDDRGNDNN